MDADIAAIIIIALVGLAGLAFYEGSAGGPSPPRPGVSELIEWNGHCPDCNGVAFVLGPKALQVSQNMTCTNCGTRINVVEHSSLGTKLYHRI